MDIGNYKIFAIFFFLQRIQCEKYDQQTPHHAKVDFLLQRNIEMVYFR